MAEGLFMGRGVFELHQLHQRAVEEAEEAHQMPGAEARLREARLQAAAGFVDQSQGWYCDASTHFAIAATTIPDGNEFEKAQITEAWNKAIDLTVNSGSVCKETK